MKNPQHGSKIISAAQRTQEEAFDNDYEKKEVAQGSPWDAYLQRKESKLMQAETQKMFQQNIDALASQSIGSRVTLREETTAEGSLEPMWSPHFPSWGFWNDLGETIWGSWAARCQEGSLNMNVSLPQQQLQCRVSVRHLTWHMTLQKRAFVYRLSCLFFETPPPHWGDVITEINSTFQTRMDLWSCDLKVLNLAEFCPNNLSESLTDSENMHD